MAIPPQKKVFKFQDRKPSFEKLNERFFKRQSSYIPFPAEQNAVAFDRNMDVQGFMFGQNQQSRAVRADIEKRLKNALRDKEFALNAYNLALENNNDDEISFYAQTNRVLDNLIKELKAEYDRANMTTAYFEKLKPIEYKTLNKSVGNLIEFEDEKPMKTEEQELAEVFEDKGKKERIAEVENRIKELQSSSKPKQDLKNYAKMLNERNPELRLGTKDTKNITTISNWIRKYAEKYM